ncbi:MAG: hypothetical protein A2381_15740 [Bdellovibrionales bacterium RIFOXYB1_FULL_37_110]|nr:MAG: hypothetical protein A2417_07590 [Bdellovibrionales bacterium RIFOXYC1_FULL_37_79]OFZ57067.1 MAG: hypothetical protein A2381_15740 [Bdellovibrionales bacterium RIFOXYB1_FULL_37_110]OFZ62082.1 MAG: hypothetical protein A2577_08490 [Bdellovibrionales bacterium RIFOXYD1_FULL_36_51]
MEQYFLGYASLEQQRWMVADKVRTDAFAKAILEVVRPGDVVIDVGAGTGILSMLAAKAGARRVIGIERSDMAILAREMVKKNNLQNQVEIFHGDANDLVLDENADVIISEWLGHMAYVERMFHSVIQVRDKHLKPGGVMLPSSVNVMLAPIDDGDYYKKEGPGFWEQAKIHGLDFSSFTKKELDMGYSNLLHVPSKFLLSEGKTIHYQKMIDAHPGDEWCMNSVDFVIERDGTLNGLVGWFSTELSSSTILDTSPRMPKTHWAQTYFPYVPMKVHKGEMIHIDYQINESYEGSRLLEIIIRIGPHEINFIVT